MLDFNLFSWLHQKLVINDVIIFTPLYLFCAKKVPKALLSSKNIISGSFPYHYVIEEQVISKG